MVRIVKFLIRLCKFLRPNLTSLPLRPITLLTSFFSDTVNVLFLWWETKIHIHICLKQLLTEQSPSWNPPPYMEPEGSLPCSQ
jgi:hypothetical protein